MCNRSAVLDILSKLALSHRSIDGTQVRILDFPGATKTFCREVNGIPIECRTELRINVNPFCAVSDERMGLNGSKAQSGAPQS